MILPDSDLKDSEINEINFSMPSDMGHSFHDLAYQCFNRFESNKFWRIIYFLYNTDANTLCRFYKSMDDRIKKLRSFYE